MVTAAQALDYDNRLDADLQRDGRLGKPRRYLAGDHDMPFMPAGAKKEYQHLAKRSVTNWLPLIPDTFARDLFVEGYRSPRAADDDAAWTYWQDNGLDARQSVVHRGALNYGVAYVLVLKGADRDRPVIRPLRPTRSAAWYRDEDDDFPEIGLVRAGRSAVGEQLVDIYDATTVYHFARSEEKLRLVGTETHGMGVVPLVRFRDRLDGEARGLVTPAINAQDRINEIVFSTMIAMQYASFRQRWATGLAVPVDDDGEPVEPFQAAVDRLWIADSPDAKFGDFAQTDLNGHQQEYKAAVRSLAATAQINPDALMGEGLVNVSEGAMVAMQASTRRKLSELQTLFGEAWEQVFRLASIAAGKPEPEASAQVRWRDIGGETLASTVDALGKLVQMLNVPARGLWERIPGTSEDDLKRWHELADVDPLTALTDELERQAGATYGATETPSVASRSGVADALEDA